MNASILIFTPTYNERANIARLIPMLRASLPDAHILVVDDDSPDGTGTLVREMEQKDSHVRLLHRSEKQGLGRAILAGMRWGIENNYDLIIQMDADLSHDPLYIAEMVKRAGDADLVIGSRYIPGGGIAHWPAHRRALSWFANIYVRTVLNLPVKDTTSGYRCWRRTALENLDLDSVSSNGYSFQVEMLHRISQRRYEIAESPIIFTDRVDGSSKLGRKVILESILMPWKLKIASSPSRFRNIPKAPRRKSGKQLLSESALPLTEQETARAVSVSPVTE